MTYRKLEKKEQRLNKLFLLFVEISLVISYSRRKKEEGRRKKKEGRRKKEEGRRKKEENQSFQPLTTS
ncbi:MULTISPECIES: hypothetical protein [unclassified Microcoleus]|uniref:hypothetical protein n=1 Tax=unclassified Microcoleus TaxID=2642155 RepID=UPI002FD1AE1D